MQSMFPAELAILHGLHPLGMVFLFLGHVVITLLALCTLQCDLDTHNFHLQ